jgi:HEAT repeat protein
MLSPPLLPRNLEASLRDLDSKKPEMRAAAIGDLVRHARGDAAVREKAIPLLAKRLEDEQGLVRSAAAVALGDLDATEAVTSLLVAVDDDAPHVRQMAINALGEIGDQRALPRLRRALEDPRPEVRYQTIIAFPRIADESETNDALFEATTDADVAIVHIALRVAEERFDNGHPAEPRLLTRARALVNEAGKNPQVALVAAILLAKAGDERGHELVKRAAKGEKIGGLAPEKEDERAAVELVGELGFKDLVPALEKRTWGALRFVRDTCPFHARIALARMGHEKAIKEILSELDSSRREVVAGAVVSAGRGRVAAARSKIEKLDAALVEAELVREALAKL